MGEKQLTAAPKACVEWGVMEQVSLSPQLFPVTWSDVVDGLKSLYQWVLTNDKVPTSADREGALLWSAADEFGTYVLQAENRDDVAARVDAVLENPRFYAVIGQLVESGTARAEEGRLGLASVRLLRKVSALKGAWGPLMDGLTVLAWLVGHLPRRQEGGGPTFDAFVAQSTREPLFFLHTMPVHAASVSLATLRMLVSVFGIGGSLLGDAVEPWRVLAVAEHFRDYARDIASGTLALLSLDETELPEGVRPWRGERPLTEDETRELYARTFAEPPLEPEPS